VKVFPCAPVGGDSYIRILKKAFSHIPLIAAGGVNQLTAQKFIVAGASALGVGSELIPEDALRLKQSERIRELAYRFVRFVNDGRDHLAALKKASRPVE
jgi:2-dehydro-3-deoxyphosphogluconate aldolase/(4S)-4-hydroxy-2-oxoglutarate aldolase